jgi:hypothetical protein
MDQIGGGPDLFKDRLRGIALKIGKSGIGDQAGEGIPVSPA